MTTSLERRPAANAHAAHVARRTLGGGEGSLVFAQVREDPLIEIEALALQPGERAVVIGSGGCTALALVATTMASVTAVDSNATQNHLIELKLAAVRSFASDDAVAFLGGAHDEAHARWRRYRDLRAHLSPNARRYWDRHRSAIERGVLHAGESERFIRVVAWVVRHLVHDDDRIARLLSCATLDEQRTLYRQEWCSRRWRALFSLLLNRWTMSRAYDARFFAHVGRRNFAEHFFAMAEHALLEHPARTNYFLSHMLTGCYPVGEQGGLPPYLDREGAARVADRAGALTLVDDGIAEYLATLDDASVDAIALSNVCEWMDDTAIDALFAQVVRVAARGARVVYRNFVGWTMLPPSGVSLRVDQELSERLSRSDRSLVQARVVVCRAPERS